MRKTVFLVLLGLWACDSRPVEDTPQQDTTVAQTDTAQVNATLDSLAQINQLDSLALASTLTGDFDGDGKLEKAFAVKLKAAKGNPEEGGTPAEFAIRFSNPKIPMLAVGCCEFRLVQEGDLTQDGKEELSVFQAPVQGDVHSLTTYSLQNGKWKTLVEPMLIPVPEEDLSDEELQKRVVREKDSLYAFQVDLDAESFRLIKKAIPVAR